MAVTEQQVLDALKDLTDPNTRKDFVSSKSARNVKVEGDNVSVDILLGYPGRSQIEPIRQAVADNRPWDRFALRGERLHDHVRQGQHRCVRRQGR